MFSICVKDGVFIQKPQHKIIQGLHRMPITGLACTNNGALFTSSLDGSVQTWTVGNVIIFELLLCKKYLLVGASGMLWMGQWMSE